MMNNAPSFACYRSFLFLLESVEPETCVDCYSLYDQLKSFGNVNLILDNVENKKNDCKTMWFALDTAQQMCNAVSKMAGYTCNCSEHRCTHAERMVKMRFAARLAHEEIREQMRDFWRENLASLLAENAVFDTLRTHMDTGEHSLRTLLRFCRRLAAQVDDKRCVFWSNTLLVMNTGKSGSDCIRAPTRLAQQQSHEWKQAWLQTLRSFVVQIRKRIFLERQQKPSPPLVQQAAQKDAVQQDATQQGDTQQDASQQQAVVLKKVPGNQEFPKSKRRKTLVFLGTNDWCKLRLPTEQAMFWDTTTRDHSHKKNVVDSSSSNVVDNSFPLLFSAQNFGRHLLQALGSPTQQPLLLTLGSEVVPISHSIAPDILIHLETQKLSKNTPNAEFFYRLLAQTCAAAGDADDDDDGGTISAQRLQLVRLYESNQLSLLQLLQVLRARFECRADLMQMKLTWWGS